MKKLLFSLGTFTLAVVVGAGLYHLVDRAYFTPPTIIKVAAQPSMITDKEILIKIIEAAGSACEFSSVTLDTVQIDFACFPPRMLPKNPKHLAVFKKRKN